VSDKNTDPHTYDATEFHNNTSSNEEPHYNTLQRDNAANILTWSNNSTILFDTYEKIGSNNTTTNDAHNHSKLGQLRGGTCRIDPEGEYDVVEFEDRHTRSVLNQPPTGMNETIQMIPQGYEPVYLYGSSNTQTKELAGKCMLFDDKPHGAYNTIPAPTRAGVQLRVDAKPNSETVKGETPTTNKEVQYADPLTPNDKSHVLRDVQAEGEHFYHSLELNEPMNPEKCISGDPYSKQYSNPIAMKERTFGSNNDLMHL
jgi:hypothetical protein